MADEAQRRIKISEGLKRAYKEGRRTDIGEKLSKALKGRVVSAEWRKKMSLAKKGKVGNNKGKHWKNTEEFKRKISDYQKTVVHTPERNANVSKGLMGNKNCLGRVISPELRKKISVGHLNSPKNCNGILAQQFRKGPTSIERKLYEELKNRGILFERQYLINGKFVVDAYVPSLNLVIEADGDYWHSLDKMIKRDRAKNAYLAKCGYKLLRLPEHQINSGVFIEKLNEQLL